MWVLGTVAEAACLPLVCCAMLAFALAVHRLRPFARPHSGIVGPPQFAVPRGTDEWKTKQRWHTFRLSVAAAALIPGLTPWRADQPSAVLPHAMIGWGGLALVSFAPGHTWVLLGGFAYQVLFFQAMALGYDVDADARWLKCLVGIDADMTRTEFHLPSCPRCRAHDRRATGWCDACDTVLSPGRLDPADWRARVGSRAELEKDGELFAHCAKRMTRSYNGSGSVRYAINRKARRTGEPTPPRPTQSDQPEYTAHVEVAYRDPDRHDLVWARVRERLALPDGGAYESSRVEAWGFVDAKFRQAWVFAPVHRFTGEATSATSSVSEPSTWSMPSRPAPQTWS